MGRESDTRSSHAWELAARQHGIVTRKQLLAQGFGRRSIQHRVERGRLFPVSLGVYAVGWPALNQKRRWMAAVLTGGEGAVLSHRSAAALWEFGSQANGRVDVSVRRRCELRRPGIRFHGRPSLRVEDVLRRDDIPVTSPTRTLLDLVNRFEVDFFWPDLGLVVETDGLRYHRTPSAQTRDARRDRAHIVAGMTPLRFTHYEVRYEPRLVRTALSKTIDLLKCRIRL